MTVERSGNWRCFFWHQWRFYRWRNQDVCVRNGCGIVRLHKPGTREE